MSNNRYRDVRESLLQNLQIFEADNDWQQVDEIRNLLDEIAAEEYAEEAGLTG